MFSIFQRFCLSNYRTYSYEDKITNKRYTSFNFLTKALPILTKMYNIFYNGKLKIVHVDLTLLPPLAH